VSFTSESVYVMWTLPRTRLEGADAAGAGLGGAGVVGAGVVGAGVGGAGVGGAGVGGAGVAGAGGGWAKAVRTTPGSRAFGACVSGATWETFDGEGGPRWIQPVPKP
jgi:hypothetical protein